MRHLLIYREPGRFAGWPANYGIWSWGNEIVVGFTLGYLDPAGGFHARDATRPFLPMQARSLDGGESWTIVATPADAPGHHGDEPHRGLSADEHMRPELRVAQTLGDPDAFLPPPARLDFTHNKFALMCARSGLNAGAVSWFYTTTDRCQTWQGPYRLPDFGQTGIAARTDYLVTGPQSATLFLTAAKPNGREGRVFCAETTDGAQSWRLRSWVTPEPVDYAIMPSTVRLDANRWLCAVRYREGERCWIDLYASDDAGGSWRYVNRPAPNTGRGGNPPAMIQLHDGRLCLTYGYRDAPFGIRARLSADEGQSWGEEIVLRDDGGNHDIGYPRTVQRPDGTIVTAYYYNDAPDGERYIAATLWEA